MGRAANAVGAGPMPWASVENEPRSSRAGMRAGLARRAKAIGDWVAVGQCDLSGVSAKESAGNVGVLIGPNWTNSLVNKRRQSNGAPRHGRCGVSAIFTTPPGPRLLWVFDLAA